MHREMECKCWKSHSAGFPVFMVSPNDLSASQQKPNFPPSLLSLDHEQL